MSIASLGRQLVLRIADEMQLGAVGLEDADCSNAKQTSKWFQEVLSQRSLGVQSQKLLRKLIQAVEPLLLKLRGPGLFAYAGHEPGNDERGDQKRRHGQGIERVVDAKRKKRLRKEQIQTRRGD